LPNIYFVPHSCLILDKDTAIKYTKQAKGTEIIVNFNSSYVNINTSFIVFVLKKTTPSTQITTFVIF
jgi:hypothetical protein